MIQDIISGTVLQVGTESVSREVEVEMAFDEENDPLALMMIFRVDGEGEVCWTVARELIMCGATNLFPVGEGDVKVRADYGNGRVLMCLTSPLGHADIGLDREELVDFLNRTQAVCPLGEEPIEALVDQELADLLGEAS